MKNRWEPKDKRILKEWLRSIVRHCVAQKRRQRIDDDIHTNNKTKRKL